MNDARMVTASFTQHLVKAVYIAVQQDNAAGQTDDAEGQGDSNEMSYQESNHANASACIHGKKGYDTS